MLFRFCAIYYLYKIFPIKYSYSNVSFLIDTVNHFISRTCWYGERSKLTFFLKRSQNLIHLKNIFIIFYLSYIFSYIHQNFDVSISWHMWGVTYSGPASHAWISFGYHYFTFKYKFHLQFGNMCTKITIKNLFFIVLRIQYKKQFAIYWVVSESHFSSPRYKRSEMYWKHIH